MSRIEGNVFVAGSLSASSLAVPAGAVTDAAVAAGAGIVATKTQHQHEIDYSQPNTTAVAETKVVHEVYGATATVVDVDAGLIAACTTGATVTIDAKKNGTSILTIPIVLDHTVAALAEVAGAIATSGGVRGDVYEVFATVAAGSGTLGTGLFVNLVIREDPQ